MTTLKIETLISKESLSYMEKEFLLPYHTQKNPPSWFKEMPAKEQWTESNGYGRFDHGSYTFKSCIGLTHWLANCISIPCPTDVEFVLNPGGEWNCSMDSDNFLTVSGFDGTAHKKFSQFLRSKDLNPQVFKLTFPYNIKLKTSKIPWFKKFFTKRYVNAYLTQPFFESTIDGWTMIPGSMPVWTDEDISLRLTCFYVFNRRTEYVKMTRGEIIGNLLINRNATDKLNIEYVSKEINDFEYRNNEAFQLLSQVTNKKAKVFNKMIKGRCPI